MKLELLERKHLKSVEDYRRELIETKSSSDGCGTLLDEGIEVWYKHCKDMEHIETLPKDRALDFKYLCLDGDEVVGIMSYRRDIELEVLREMGGHIGYSVKPSRRRQGIAKWQLKELLKIIKEEGYNDKVMITCDVDNEGSRRTILACGGVYQDTNTYKGETVERYWITL